VHQRRVWPLTELGNRLRSYWPPHLSGLLELFEAAETYEEFLRLVAEYLPESLDVIRQTQGVTERIAKFGELFRKRYFPLAWYIEEGDPYDELGYTAVFNDHWEGGIPILRAGCDWDDIDEMDHWQYGELLMGSLCLPGMLDNHGVVWLEACAEKYPGHATQLRRIPAGGWSHEDLRYYLQGSAYEALLKWANFVFSNTGNAFLDTNQERGFADPWAPETVEYLVKHWELAELFFEEAGKLGEWLEDLGNYQELLDFILQQEGKFGQAHEEEGPPAPPRTLLEVFTQEEDDYDE